LVNVETGLAVAGLAIAIIGIAVRMERRMGKALTRDEHERICSERNLRVEKQLDDLRDDMERRHEENRETFDKIETATTGTHKLIVDLYRDLLQRGGR
jgi:C4-dicarboxylate-specific signal transduction histidine kinase